MKDKIFYNEKGYIEIKPVGRLSFTDTLKIGEEYIKIETRIGGFKKRIRMLIDMTEAEDWNENTFSIVGTIFGDIGFFKSASFGGNEKVVELQRKVIAKTHAEDRSKIFSTREEAEAWLIDENTDPE